MVEKWRFAACRPRRHRVQSLMSHKNSIGWVISTLVMAQRRSKTHSVQHLGSSHSAQKQPNTADSATINGEFTQDSPSRVVYETSWIHRAKNTHR
jgi:hypothetical protein